MSGPLGPFRSLQLDVAEVHCNWILYDSERRNWCVTRRGNFQGGSLVGPWWARFFPTSLCGVLVFGSVSFPASRPPGLPASRPPPPLFRTQLCHTHSFTHNFVIHNSSTHNFVTHTIFYTQLCHTHTHSFVTDTQLCHTHSFANNFVTHTQALCHTQLYYTQLCHTHTHTHTHTSLSHTYNSSTHKFVTRNFVTHTHDLSHTRNFVIHNSFTHTTSLHTHTIFYTQLCHTHTALSQTHNFVTHTLSRTTLSHTHRHSVTHNFITRNFATHTRTHLCHTHIQLFHTQSVLKCLHTEHFTATTGLNCNWGANVSSEPVQVDICPKSKNLKRPQRNTEKIHSRAGHCDRKWPIRGKFAQLGSVGCVG